MGGCDDPSSQQAASYLMQTPQPHDSSWISGLENECMDWSASVATAQPVSNIRGFIDNRQMNQLFHGRWQKQVMKLKSHVKICLTRSSRFYQINIIKKILRAFWFFITGKSTHAINTINNGSFQKSQSVTESRPFLTVINQNVFTEPYVLQCDTV